MKNKKVQCDAKIGREKHNKPTYKCEVCSSVFCFKCARQFGYTCHFCEPSLVKIK